jgi:hypothetical protein
VLFRSVTIECLSNQKEANLELEYQAVEKKKDLFEEVFKKNLVVLWKKQ